MDWYQKYGAVYRTKGCFGQDILSVADPKVLQYIFHLLDFLQRVCQQDLWSWSFSVLIALIGQIHQHQRRILGPTFTVSQLRLFLNFFQALAVKVQQVYGLS
ncbi:hypothetical protein ARMGADRAFT_1105058 [Armillaria gallica]|uniref:Uncharacterized protein n=1 Tax=Armillaria gallica TaxID=47427 RepID=A0A2H3DN17_ARMGA|nr:hypothetical protein ARMGADRAFT_1105058 [Armillaria gallica]